MNENNEIKDDIEEISPPTLSNNTPKQVKKLERKISNYFSPTRGATSIAYFSWIVVKQAPYVEIVNNFKQKKLARKEEETDRVSDIPNKQEEEEEKISSSDGDENLKWKTRRRSSKSEEESIQSTSSSEASPPDDIKSTPTSSIDDSGVGKQEMENIEAIQIDLQGKLVKRALKMLQVSHSLMDDGFALAGDYMQNPLEMEIREQIRIIEEASRSIKESKLKVFVCFAS